MWEILLTRIFSISMWYHYAFIAISVGMFGMTVGAIFVYLKPDYFTDERVKYHLTLYSLIFAITIFFCSLIYMSIPFVMEDRSIVALFSIVLSYVVISVPFFFGGVCVCLALTKFPGKVGKLYGVDLAGAALGCIIIIFVLKITDGPTAILVVSALASLGALFFALDRDSFAFNNSKRLRNVSIAAVVIFSVLAVWHTGLVQKQSPLLRMIWVKGELEARPLYEKWNSFSRVKVVGNPELARPAFGWGISYVYPVEKNLIPQLYLDIDAGAGTVLTRFDGDFNKVDYLKYDITNLAHHIKSDANVLVIGTGGGRDILSALTFGQKSVTGVEINGVILDTANNKFGDFTGHLDKYPQATFVNDEGRSFITRSKDKYDIIHVSFIDTWAATAAGAYTLTENALYTVEGWEVFLNHLTDNGVISFSRWYIEENPGEVYRLLGLAVQSLLNDGIENPREHLAIYKTMGREGNENVGIATLIVSKKPFTWGDLYKLDSVSTRMRFDEILSPTNAVNETFAEIASGDDLEAVAAKSVLNITPPTDNSPFFFNMVSFTDLFNTDLWKKMEGGFNLKAVFILAFLLVTVIVLTFLCIIVPLLLTTKKGDLKGSFWLFIFFASIGFGFMFIEISQMQRLIIFLGHPIYGLSVVLFALLLSSGIGSFLTKGIDPSINPGPARSRLIITLIVLVIFGLITNYAAVTFRGSVTSVRIIVAVAMLFPIGIFMGMAFPIGIKLASGRGKLLTPWLWGINGATSVCASVAAVAIALSTSISTTYWFGSLCYALALISFVLAARIKGNSAS
jgi:hypothetical protein